MLSLFLACVLAYSPRRLDQSFIHSAAIGGVVVRIGRESSDHPVAENATTTPLSVYTSLMLIPPMDPLLMDLEIEGGQIMEPSMYFQSVVLDTWAALTNPDAVGTWGRSASYAPLWKYYGDELERATFAQFHAILLRATASSEAFSQRLFPFLESWPVTEFMGQAYEQYIQLFSDMLVALKPALLQPESNGRLVMRVELESSSRGKPEGFVDKLTSRACNELDHPAVFAQVSRLARTLVLRSRFVWQRGDMSATIVEPDKIALLERGEHARTDVMALGDGEVLSALNDRRMFTMCEYVREALMSRQIVTAQSIEEAQLKWSEYGLDSIGRMSYDMFQTFLREKMHAYFFAIPPHMRTLEENEMIGHAEHMFPVLFRAAAINTIAKVVGRDRDVLEVIPIEELDLCPCEFQLVFSNLNFNTVRMIEQNQKPADEFSEFAPCGKLAYKDFLTLMQMHSASRTAYDDYNQLFHARRLFFDPDKDKISGGKFASALFDAIAAGHGRTGVMDSRSRPKLSKTQITNYFSMFGEQHYLDERSLRKFQAMTGHGSDKVTWQQFSKALIAHLPYESMTQEDVSNSDLQNMGVGAFRKFWVCLSMFAHLVEEGHSGQISMEAEYGEIKKEMRFPEYYTAVCSSMSISCDSSARCPAPRLRPHTQIVRGCQGDVPAASEGVVAGQCKLECEEGHESNEPSQYECKVIGNKPRYYSTACSTGSCPQPDAFVCEPMRCEKWDGDRPGVSILQGCQAGPIGSPCYVACEPGHNRKGGAVAQTNFPCKAQPDKRAAYEIHNDFVCEPESCKLDPKQLAILGTRVITPELEGLDVQLFPLGTTLTISCLNDQTPEDATFEPTMEFKCLPLKSNPRLVDFVILHKGGQTALRDVKCSAACTHDIEAKCKSSIMEQACVKDVDGQIKWYSASNVEMCCTRPDVMDDTVCERGTCRGVIPRTGEYCLLDQGIESSGGEAFERLELSRPHSPKVPALLIRPFKVEETAPEGDRGWIKARKGVCEGKECRERVCTQDMVSFSMASFGHQQIELPQRPAGSKIKVPCSSLSGETTGPENIDPTTDGMVFQCRPYQSHSHSRSLLHESYVWEWMEKESRCTTDFCASATVMLPKERNLEVAMPNGRRLGFVVRERQSKSGTTLSLPCYKGSASVGNTWIGQIELKCQNGEWKASESSRCFGCVDYPRWKSTILHMTCRDIERVSRDPETDDIIQRLLHENCKLEGSSISGKGSQTALDACCICNYDRAWSQDVGSVMEKLSNPAIVKDVSGLPGKCGPTSLMDVSSFKSSQGVPVKAEIALRNWMAVGETSLIPCSGRSETASLRIESPAFMTVLQGKGSSVWEVTCSWFDSQQKVVQWPVVSVGSTEQCRVGRTSSCLCTKQGEATSLGQCGKLDSDCGWIPDLSDLTDRQAGCCISRDWLLWGKFTQTMQEEILRAPELGEDVDARSDLPRLHGTALSLAIQDYFGRLSFSTKGIAERILAEKAVVCPPARVCSVDGGSCAEATNQLSNLETKTFPRIVGCDDTFGGIAESEWQSGTTKSMEVTCPTKCYLKVVKSDKPSADASEYLRSSHICANWHATYKEEFVAPFYTVQLLSRDGVVNEAETILYSFGASYESQELALTQSKSSEPSAEGYMDVALKRKHVRSLVLPSDQLRESLGDSYVEGRCDFNERDIMSVEDRMQRMNAEATDLERRLGLV